MGVHLGTFDHLLAALAVAWAPALTAHGDEAVRPASGLRFVPAVLPAASQPAAADVALAIPFELGVPAEPATARRSWLVPSLEVVAIQSAMVVYNDKLGKAKWANISLHSIGRNLTSPWVFDDDQYWVNQVFHPYQGTWTHTAGRSAGLSFWEAAALDLGASMAWEIAGETERPSLNDQVTTTVGGAVLGEVFHRAIGLLWSDPGWHRQVAAGILSPPAALNRSVVGDWSFRPSNPSELTARAGVLTFEDGRGSTDHGQPVPDVGLRFVYGPADHPETNLREPFDHLDFQFEFGAYKDPLVAIFARGLLLGQTLEGEDARGLWGMYLGFDLLTAGQARVSTSNVGAGIAGRFDLGGSTALHGSAVISAVPLGAAGWAWPGEDGAGRDYVLGPGGQAILEARLVGARAELGAALRDYLLFGAGNSGGREHTTYATGSALLRIFGPHALGVEALLLRWEGRGVPRTPDVIDHGTVLRAFYAFAPAPSRSAGGPPTPP